MAKIGMGGHQSSDMLNDEWITPRKILASLGQFDLDPCAPVKSPWPTAKKTYNKFDDGLSLPWEGRCFVNPPYGKIAEKWLQKLAEHKNGIALIFARTETEAFFKTVWPHAHSILFLKGRLTFHYVDGTKAKANSGAPSVLISYDAVNTQYLKISGLEGKLIILK